MSSGGIWRCCLKKWFVLLYAELIETLVVSAKSVTFWAQLSALSFVFCSFPVMFLLSHILSCLFGNRSAKHLSSHSFLCSPTKAAWVGCWEAGQLEQVTSVQLRTEWQLTSAGLSLLFHLVSNAESEQSQNGVWGADRHQEAFWPSAVDGFCLQPGRPRRAPNSTHASPILAFGSS